jgi:cytochrome c peroxidase
MRLYFFILAAFLPLLMSCESRPVNEQETYTPANASASVLRSEWDIALSEVIKQQGLTGNPVRTSTPSIDSPKAQLGMLLFFNKALSGNLDVACASCHHPLLGGGDNLSLSVGVDAADPDLLGHGRVVGGNQAIGVPRNAPTTFNIGLWQQVMFHDGRVAQVTDGITTPDKDFPRVDPLAGRNLVHAQARFPITSVAEMRGKQFDKHGTAQSCREALAGRLGGYQKAPKALQKAATRYWLDAFRQAYNSPTASPKVLITEQNIAEVLAEYQRSQVFVNNPWRSYINGDLDAINTTAKQGALLFFKGRDQGGYACASCHRGDFFTDEGFHNILLPPLGPGKAAQDGGATQLDLGRFLVTQREEDKFRFRTPSLLNVEVTGPWGHNGAYTSLDAMVAHMLHPFNGAIYYDSAQLRQPNVQTQHLRENIREILRSNSDLSGQGYEEQHVRQLVAFLQTLTDPCTRKKECIGKWVPTAERQDPMGLQLNARFSD